MIHPFLRILNTFDCVQGDTYGFINEEIPSVCSCPK